MVIILRKNHVHHTGDAVIFHAYDSFSGFPVKEVPAYYRKNDEVPGYSVGLVLQQSPADADFGVPILFLREEDIRVIDKALDKSDQLTFQLLGREWGGKRPVNMADFM